MIALSRNGNRQPVPTDTLDENLLRGLLREPPVQQPLWRQSHREKNREVIPRGKAAPLQGDSACDSSIA
jgi:hypothetical protein